ncbi:MAG: NAD(P)/FAD-dependent oxidoreductase, partial [Thermoanaerobaculia bacterium]|nr:NAD(P)/FAD-dependent oxidoreductase [Thermoanaerobaculia bacterium]
MGREPDVLVVGGGPAGLATALAARRSGLEVTVLEKGEPGRDKACGEGLMPDAVAAAGRLGVDLTDLGLPFRGIRYLDSGLVAEGSFSRGSGLGIRRTRLHRALARAAETAGAEIRWGVRVEGLLEEGVETSSCPVHARWVVGADGLHSRVRRWSGLGAEAGKRRRFGVRRHLHRPPWTDRVEVYWSDGAEAYVTPVASDLVGVALLWGGKTAAFDDLLPRFPRLEERLAGADRASRDR